MKKTIFYFLSLALFFAMNIAKAQKNNIVWLDDLTIKSFSEGIPSVSAKLNAGNDSMRMHGMIFKRGVGVNSTSVLSFYLDGHATEFSAVVGVDDKGMKNLPHRFYVIGDRKILFDSGDMKLGDEPKQVKVTLNGIKRLGLLVTVDARVTMDYTNWANAQLVMKDDFKPQNIPNTDEKYILTPPSVKTPKINSPKLFGATPNNSVLYTIATTGERPMSFSVKNLPKGLSVDTKTGIISGKIAQKGVYSTVLKAKNTFGEATKELKIVIGDTIALTPPIGWNGWNSWARNIDREKVIASADALVKMGLSQHGWTYINIDDAWQGNDRPECVLPAV